VPSILNRRFKARNRCGIRYVPTLFMGDYVMLASGKPVSIDGCQVGWSAYQV
jgi:hypothetical protein